MSRKIKLLFIFRTVFIAVVCFFLLNQKEGYTNNLGMKMKGIRGGNYLVGDIKNNFEFDKEFKVKQKNVEAFYISTTEVTQQQWMKIMKSNPSKIKGDDLPVTNLSLEQINVFLEKLSLQEKRTYRLPTNTEWEIACRAGSKEIFYFGNKSQAKKIINNYTWNGDNGNDIPHTVATKLPNNWGIYDMSGNIAELCFENGKFFLRGGSAKKMHAHFPAVLFLTSVFYIKISKGEYNDFGSFTGFRCVAEIK